MSIVEGVGWAFAVLGLAVSTYSAATGKWVTLPRPFGVTNYPATRVGRRLSGLAGIIFFVAVSIEFALVPQRVPRSVVLAVILGVFILIMMAVFLQVFARRIKP